MAGAIESAKLAVQLQPGNMDWLLAVTDLLVQDGQVEEAGRIIANIDRAIPDPSSLPEPLRTRLKGVRAALEARKASGGSE